MRQNVLKAHFVCKLLQFRRSLNCNVAFPAPLMRDRR
jgi:hypothetical protein